MHSYVFVSLQNTPPLSSSFVFPLSLALSVSLAFSGTCSPFLPFFESKIFLQGILSGGSFPDFGWRAAAAGLKPLDAARPIRMDVGVNTISHNLTLFVLETQTIIAKECDQPASTRRAPCS